MLVAMLLLGISLSAQQTPELILEDVKFNLIPSTQHEVYALYSTERKRIYFSDDFLIYKKDINTDEIRSFFLNKDLMLESMSLNGKDQPVYYNENIRTENFDPRLRLQALIDVSQYAQVYSIFVPDVNTLTDTIKVKLKYYLALDDKMKFTEDTPEFTKLRGQNFWYPRNIVADESVSLKVSTPLHFRIEIKDVEIGYKVENKRRINQIRFTDKNEAPVDLTFVKE